MAYTDIDKPSDYFNTITYTGSGTSTAYTVGFQPDWVWVKKRDTETSNHILVDSVRTTAKTLFSDLTSEELTETNITSFDSNGFSAASSGATNQNGHGYVAWNWKAGTSFTNDASATGIGSIDSTGSVNTTSGFSIISYTGTGSAGTVAHGLGSGNIPKMIIVKNRNGTQGWAVYHASLGNTKFLQLNATAAAGTASTFWNNTTPTSSVFSIGTSGWVNNSGENYIAYCFAKKKGYSKFGSYVGNGSSDGTFVYTGGKISWLMVKRTDSAQGWYILDNKRNTFNPEDKYLEANDSDAEATFTFCDFLSNGFKARVDNTGTGFNASGGSYIYMCFNENPFTTSTGVPATAR